MEWPLLHSSNPVQPLCAQELRKWKVWQTLPSPKDTIHYRVSRLTNCRFTTISSQISAIYINIFHKTEVQTVILRCWTGLYHNWFKSYDKNEKHVKNAKTPKIAKHSTWILYFLQNCRKPKIEIIAFCVITFQPIKVQTCSAPQNDRLNLSFVKDIYVDGGNLA